MHSFAEAGNTDRDALRQLQIPADRKKIRSHVAKKSIMKGQLDLVILDAI